MLAANNNSELVLNGSNTSNLLECRVTKASYMNSLDVTLSFLLLIFDSWYPLTRAGPVDVIAVQQSAK